MTLIGVEEALALIARHAIDTGHETVTIGQAAGRIAAVPLIAAIAQPASALSAMDGYAVRLQDVARPGAILRVIGESAAGNPFVGRLAAGEAVRIFTGAVLPASADHILIQEDVIRADGNVTYDGSDSAPRLVRPAGGDFAKGDTLFNAGQRIGPAQILVAAAAGHGHLVVRRRPGIALLANGNELKHPGAPLAAGETVNSCAPALAALFESWGCDVTDLGIAADDIADISGRIAGSADADLIVPIGGASVGDHDHMHAAVRGHDFESIFARVNVRPGKPTWFGRIASHSGRRQYILGLPGNPASAFVCAHLFARPLLAMPPLPAVTARLTVALPQNGPRETYLRAIHRADSDGQFETRAHDRQDSGLVTPFLSATCLIPRAANAPAIAVGERVEIRVI